MSNRLVTVATFWNAADAHVAQGQLTAAGLQSFLADEHLVDAAWYYGNAIGGVKLKCREEDVVAALQVLSEFDAARGASAVEKAPVNPSFLELWPAAAADEPAELPLNRREEDADRAWRATLFSLWLGPLDLYAWYLLLRVFFSNEPLRADQRRAAEWAVIVNLLFLILGTFVLWRLVGLD